MSIDQRCFLTVLFDKFIIFNVTSQSIQVSWCSYVFTSKITYSELYSYNMTQIMQHSLSLKSNIVTYAYYIDKTQISNIWQVYCIDFNIRNCVLPIHIVNHTFISPKVQYNTNQYNMVTLLWEKIHTVSGYKTAISMALSSVSVTSPWRMLTSHFCYD